MSLTNQKLKSKKYQDQNRLQIAFPLGGIGTGCICLNGEGGLQDFSIRHKPKFSSLPDEVANELNTDAAFALLHLPGENITRLVEGPMPPEKIYNQGLKSQGYRAGGHEGLPRFRNCVFQGEYPLAQISLSDPALPLDVTLDAFNPFIPLDDKNSGIPCAILEYTLHNHSAETVPYEFSYHVSHFAPGLEDIGAAKSRNGIIPGRGVFFYNIEHSGSAAYGSAALGVIGFKPAIKAMWFRGGWFDAISALWREVSSGSFQPNDGSDAALCESGEGIYRDDVKRRNGGSILLKGELAAGEEITYPIVISWYFPNVDYDFINKTPQSQDGKCCCSSGEGSCKTPAPKWRPWYAGQWADAGDVLCYVTENYSSLRHRTHAFHDALFASSLPAEVLEAVSANLAILKSPTVLRQENGTLWAWEGCYCDRGCCRGSCTHVWNYAQAVAHLYPQLERTLREQELERSMDEFGHISFRSSLPDGPTNHDFHAAADGQLGGIMKVYREWWISADPQWLKRILPLAKRSLDYCIETWDPRHTGLLEEPHHNTYDIEFWGPDGMCSSFYLGALVALAALLRAEGDVQSALVYEELAARGASTLDRELYNGEYYEQKVRWEGLKDTSFADRLKSHQSQRASNGRGSVFPCRRAKVSIRLRLHFGWRIWCLAGSIMWFGDTSEQ